MDDNDRKITINDDGKSKEIKMESRGGYRHPQRNGKRRCEEY